MRLHYLLAICVLLFSNAFSQEDCNYTHGKVNRYVSRSEPRFVKKATNGHGSLYVLEDAKMLVKLKVVVVDGTPLEQGRAIGELIKEDIVSVISILPPYFEIWTVNYLSRFIPSFLAKFLSLFAQYVFTFLLNLTHLLSKPYTPQRVYDELLGISQTTSIPYMELVRWSMLPELSKAHCTLAGIWAPASKSGVHFLRTVDWDYHNPVSNFPVMIVYHPSSGFPYANIGYAGLFGLITGVNSNGLAIGMKSWYPDEEDNAEISFAGTPWHYVLRDVMQYSTDFQSALNVLFSNKRTATIYVVLASKKDQAARAMYYASNKVVVFDDMHFPHNSSKHPLIKGAVYWDKSGQPTDNDCVGGLLKKNHGKTNAEFLAQNVAGWHQTGTIFVSAFDLHENTALIGYNQHEKTLAYEEGLFKVNLTNLFRLPAA